MQATPATLKELVLLSNVDESITETYALWVVFAHTQGFHTQGRNPVKTLVTITSDIGRLDVSVTIDTYCVQLPTITTRCGIVHSPKILRDVYIPIVEAFLLGKFPTMVGTAPDNLREVF